jgi:hypothetical protein
VGFLPEKAGNAKQKAFVEEKLKPLIKLAKEGVYRVIFCGRFSFCDGRVYRDDVEPV